MRKNAAELKSEARNRWPSLLLQLGVDESVLSGRNQPCPSCGGRDRFRFTDYQGDGLWICSQCGAGDGFDLLKLYHGWTFADAARRVTEMLPNAQVETPDHDAKRKALAELRRITENMERADRVPQVVEYLGRRGLRVPPGLRAHRTLPYYDPPAIAHYTAMLGPVQTKNGRLVGLHRTYLKSTDKALVDSPRKLTRSTRGTKGWAIRLWPARDRVVIAEGIETAIACEDLWKCPAWSVVSAQGLIAFDPPEGIKRIIVAGDNDANFTGQAAAYEAARRLKAKGYGVEVRIPDEPGDFNDVLLEKRDAS